MGEIRLARNYGKGIGYSSVAVPGDSEKEQVFKLLDMVLASIKDDTLRNFS